MRNWKVGVGRRCIYYFSVMGLLWQTQYHQFCQWWSTVVKRRLLYNLYFEISIAIVITSMCLTSNPAAFSIFLIVHGKIGEMVGFQVKK